MRFMESKENVTEAYPALAKSLVHSPGWMVEDEIAERSDKFLLVERF